MTLNLGNFNMNALRQYLDFQATALDIRERRNTLLGSNIANAGTPGYKARDIDFESELAAHTQAGSIRTTKSAHLDPDGPSERSLFRDPLNPSIDGNTVELHVEQLEFSENTVRYASSLTFLNNRITGLMSAIRGE
jgi:flagellar basal-body rod protein FlgB